MTEARVGELPRVAFDEAGNTGQNLLDATQPVFVLASVHMPPGRAGSLAAAATPPGGSEAKFAALRSSNAGRKRVLSVLRDGALTPNDAKVCVYHKSFMVTTRIVDALVETWHHARGIDLYENAAHLGLANLLHAATPVFCGADAFREWQTRFVAMVRQKSPERVEAFYAQTAELRTRNSNPDFDIFLAVLERTREVVDEGIREDDKIALDPAVPALVQLAAEWSATLGHPFDLVHDHSKPLAYGREQLRLLLAVDELPRNFDNMGLKYAFPIQAPDIRFADSRDVPELQLADVVAGAAATLFRARARGEPDPFAEALLHAGIATVVSNVVWPDTAVTPGELGAHQRPGSKGLEFVVELASRRSRQRPPGAE